MCHRMSSAHTARRQDAIRVTRVEAHRHGPEWVVFPIFVQLIMDLLWQGFAFPHRLRVHRCLHRCDRFNAQLARVVRRDGAGQHRYQEKNK